MLLTGSLLVLIPGNPGSFLRALIVPSGNLTWFSRRLVQGLYLELFVAVGRRTIHSAFCTWLRCTLLRVMKTSQIELMLLHGYH